AALLLLAPRPSPLAPLNSRLHIRRKFLRADADRCAGRAGTDAGGSACLVLAHVALDGFLAARWFVLLVVGCFARTWAAAEHQPLQQSRLLRRLRRHVNHAVRTVALAIAAADTVVGDEHFAVRRAMDRIGRAVLHAMRMFAMPARGRHVHAGERRAGFTIKARR